MSGEQFLIVVAEGGPLDGRKLYSGALTDGVLSVGRAFSGSIILPSDESAIGQHHCDLRIHGGAVWLEPRPHQEVYVDGGTDAPDKAKSVEAAELLLSTSGQNVRVIELGGLARSPARTSGAFAQTRLRVMITQAVNAPVDTPQKKAAKRNQKNAKREIGLLTIGVVAFFASGLAMLGLGVLFAPPAFAAIMDQLAGIRKDISKVDRRLADGVITALERQHGQTLELLKSLPEKLNRPAPSYYETVRPSIWLVGILGADETFEGVGTAWVIAGATDNRRSLITNKHVANILLERANKGQPAIRRFSEAGPEQYLLDASTLSNTRFAHPLFAELDKLVQADGTQDKPVNVADIARLVLEDPANDEKLGTGIEIASRDEIMALKEMDAVGYVGFPFENLGAGGPSVAEPKPMFVGGVIVRLSGPLQTVVDQVDQQLLMMDAISTGGASGSPVFNKDGRVVAIISGGDVVHLDASIMQGDKSRLADPDKAELRLPVGFTYAIRADVVNELVSGQMDTLRLGRWQAKLNKIGARATEEREKFAGWKAMSCGDANPRYAILPGDPQIGGDGRLQLTLAKVSDPKTSHYFSVRALSRGKLEGIDILVGPNDLPKPTGDPAEFQLSKSRRVGDVADARLMVSGTPGAVVQIEQYSCPPPIETGAAE